MRLSSARITANTSIYADLHLIEMHAPQLAQAVLPGQYCMIRCCPKLATDPLLRRPFFLHSVRRDRGMCTLLVNVRGRGSAWLAQQGEGQELDILGPLGQSWSLRPTMRNILLIADNAQVSALTLLAQHAIAQEIGVTLLCWSRSSEVAYPPALLAPEVEYHIVGSNDERQDSLVEATGEYLNWVDAAYCSVSRETAFALYSRYERLRGKHFAQEALLRPLACGNGVCLACSVETRSGQKLLCRDGPIFDLREIASL